MPEFLCLQNRKIIALSNLLNHFFKPFICLAFCKIVLKMPNNHAVYLAEYSMQPHMRQDSVHVFNILPELLPEKYFILEVWLVFCSYKVFNALKIASNKNSLCPALFYHYSFFYRLYISDRLCAA